MVQQALTMHLCFLQGLEVKVWLDYEQFIGELGDRFPHERRGIRKFYDECWRVFNSLNSLELKSLEEPRYLLGRRFKSCCIHRFLCCQLVNGILCCQEHPCMSVPDST